MKVPDFETFISQLDTDKLDEQLKTTVETLEKDNMATVVSISIATTFQVLKEYHHWLSDNL